MTRKPNVARVIWSALGWCALVGALVWGIQVSSIGSPVSVGQSAVIAGSGSVALADSIGALDRMTAEQQNGVELNGLDLIDRGMSPLRAGTRVQVLSLGWDGLKRTARIRVLDEDALLQLQKALAGKLSPVEGWVYAQWLAP